MTLLQVSIPQSVVAAVQTADKSKLETSRFFWHIFLPSK